MPFNVAFTPEFKRNLRILSKKYRHIRDDVEPLIITLQNGELPGDQVTGTGYTIFKVRVPNRDVKRGKSGGYRVIYYLQTQTDIILVTIYSKTEQADISAAQIRRIVNEFEAEK
jgi:mRNA-degrading endonuclease RelE of RelBE toxin-antitoxin system